MLGTLSLNISHYFVTSLIIWSLFIIPNFAEWDNFEINKFICTCHFEKLNNCSIFRTDAFLHRLIIKYSMLEKVFFEQIRTMKINTKNRTAVFIPQRKVGLTLLLILNGYTHKYFHCRSGLCTFIYTFRCAKKGPTVAENTHKFEFYKIYVNYFDFYVYIISSYYLRWNMGQYRCLPICSQVLFIKVQVRIVN